MHHRTQLQFLFAIALSFVCSSVFAQIPVVPPNPAELSITDKAGSKLAIESLKFQDEKGEKVPLSKYFQTGRPVLLSLVYYECPTLCSLVMNGILDGAKALQWTIGKEYDVIHVSIDPRESFALATQKKDSYIKAYGRLGAENGWHFLTGSEDQIKALADAVGFGFRYDPKSKEYAHSAGIFVLTPDGRISRTLYGIQYVARDLRFSLIEASDGKIGTVLDRIVLYCYRYDPASRKYSLYAMRLMRAGGAGTLLVFGGYLWVFWQRQRRGKDRRS